MWAPLGFDVNLQTGVVIVGLFPTQFSNSIAEFENTIGAAGADVLRGTSLANVLDGGAGNDFLEGQGGADTLIGGEGTGDVASYQSSAAAVVVNLSLKGAQVSPGTDAHGDTLIGIEHIFGSDYGDTLTGSSGDDLLFGRWGNDLLQGGKGADVLNGLGDIDTASYAASSAGVSINLALGTASGGDAAGDTLASIENLIGSAFADDLTGSSAVNIIDGGGGNDILTAYGDGDTLIGGAGNDRIYASGNSTQGKGGTGNDTLIGNVSFNTLFGDESNDVIDAGAGGDILSGGSGRDRFVFSDGYDFDYISDFQAGSKGDYLDLRRISNLTYYQQLLTPGAITQGAGYTDINLVYFNGDSGDTIRLLGVTASSLRPGNFILN